MNLALTLGICGSAYFLLRTLELPPSWSAIGSLLCRVGFSLRPASAGPAGPHKCGRRLQPTLHWAPLLIWLIAFCIQSYYHPQGEWDGWAMWNMRAKFMSAPNWRDAASPLLYMLHPDYPLLLPSLIGAGWAIVPGTPNLVPILIAACFAVATFSMVAGRHPLAGAILLAPLTFIGNTAYQQADVPVGCFLLASLALLSAGRPAWAGAAAGFAAFTKDEGTLYAVCLLAALAAFHRPLLSRFAAGLAPALLPLLYFKLAVAPHLAPAWIWTQVADPARWMLILRHLAQQALRFGVAPLLLVFAARPQWRSWPPGAAALPLIAAGFGVVYLVTPAPLDWLLTYSLERLIVQLWPAAVFAVFASGHGVTITGAPERTPC